MRGIVQGAKDDTDFSNAGRLVAKHFFNLGDLFLADRGSLTTDSSPQVKQCFALGCHRAVRGVVWPSMASTSRLAGVLT